MFFAKFRCRQFVLIHPFLNMPLFLFDFLSLHRFLFFSCSVNEYFRIFYRFQLSFLWTKCCRMNSVYTMTFYHGNGVDNGTSDNFATRTLDAFLLFGQTHYTYLCVLRCKHVWHYQLVTIVVLFTFILRIPPTIARHPPTHLGISRRKRAEIHTMIVIHCPSALRPVRHVDVLHFIIQLLKIISTLFLCLIEM